MITINYGKNWVKTTYDTLAKSDINSYLSKGMVVSIKPNLVIPSPPNNGATTHPEVLEGIIQFLNDFGIQKIQIMESSAVGYSTQKAYKVCGYEYLEKKYGVTLIDLKNSNFKTLRPDDPLYNGLEIQIAEEALNAEFLINVPVLKAHCQTRLTCCMKNLKGCIPEKEMRRFHTLGLHKPIAALASLLPIHYNVIDGICGDLTFEEGGSPIEANRIIAGRNPVLLDSYCAELIGYKPESIGYLAYARNSDIGEFYSPETTVIELNSNQKPIHQQKANRLSKQYHNKNIKENAACSVCYASLMFALHQVGGTADTINKKICIGQGFKGKTSKSIDVIGIGNCTCGYDTYVAGCPPKAVDIIEVIQ
ncbi:MAG: DUF362 domain-containing protein [Defluviitaleaceae bacterium]|nr:DUF362 domain-containing protein [Defluviitaleaceae bacterium]